MTGIPVLLLTLTLVTALTSTAIPQLGSAVVFFAAATGLAWFIERRRHGHHNQP